MPHQTLAQAIGVSPRTIQRRIAALKGAKLLTTRSRYRQGRQTSNHYKLDKLVDALGPYAEEELKRRANVAAEQDAKLTRKRALKAPRRRS